MAGFDLNSIMSLVTGSGASALGKSVGADEKKVNSVVSAAVPLLIGKMEDNTSTKAGAKSLNKALSDHAGDDITDIASFLSNADTDDGEKILKHILGDDQNKTTKALSKKSGLSNKQVTGILAALAPLLLTLIGNNKKDDDDDGSSLGGLLGGLLGGSSNNASSGILGSLLGASSGNSSGGLLGSLLGGSSSNSSSSSGGIFGNLLGGLLGGDDEEEEKEESKPASSGGGLLGGLMGIFGDREALEEAKEENQL